MLEVKYIQALKLQSPGSGSPPPYPISKICFKTKIRISRSWGGWEWDAVPWLVPHVLGWHSSLLNSSQELVSPAFPSISMELRPHTSRSCRKHQRQGSSEEVCAGRGAGGCKSHSTMAGAQHTLSSLPQQALKGKRNKSGRTHMEEAKLHWVWGSWRWPHVGGGASTAPLHCRVCG